MILNQLIYRVAQLMLRVGFSFHEEADPRVQAMQEKIS